MKSKRKSSSSKSRSKSKRSSAPKRRKSTGRRTKSKPIARGRSTFRIASELGPPPAPPEPDYKTCQEPEVGDIGGFGDVSAYEAHEKVCGERATDYCTTCAKNLCNSHYMLMHSAHNRGDQGISYRQASSSI